MSRAAKTWRHSSLRSWLNSKLLSHPLSAPVVLVAVLLAVYYPALLSGIHPIDDPGLFALYSVSPSLSSILMPGNSYYYRPVVELTFFLDNFLWGMEPGVMHLENILLHCANSLLVYVLARKISRDNDNLLLPFFAALLFALHPINVEAVTWIAGRTDPLLALFILSASFFWLNWLEEPRWHDMGFALLLSAAAVLTKETAFAFSAVVLLFAFTWPGTATRLQRMKAVIIVAAPCVLLVMFALLFRSGTSGLSRFMADLDLQIVKGVSEALIALGFYFKKLLFPFPLNFAITAVHPIYVLPGLLLFPVLWWMLRRFRLSGVFFVSAALLILPAILVAVKQVAWTPFAERYLYLSTAFIMLGFVGICETWQRKHNALLTVFLVILVCGSAIMSFQRNLLWKDTHSFFAEAVVKSPEFGSLYHSLGGILMQKGEIDRAVEAFATADRLNQRVSMRYPIKSSIMGTKIAKGEFLAARMFFFQLFKKKQDAPVDFLELLYTADGKRLNTLEEVEKVLLAHDLLETLDVLNQKKPDPFWLYRRGQIALVTGNSFAAADSFRKAYYSAPPDAHYKAAAKTYFMRLDAVK